MKTALRTYGSGEISIPLSRRYNSEQDVDQLYEKVNEIKQIFDHNLQAIHSSNQGIKYLVAVGATVILASQGFIIYLIFFDPERKMGNPSTLFPNLNSVLVMCGLLAGFGYGRHQAIDKIPMRQINELLDNLSGKVQPSKTE